MRQPNCVLLKPILPQFVLLPTDPVANVGAVADPVNACAIGLYQDLDDVAAGTAVDAFNCTKLNLS